MSGEDGINQLSPPPTPTPSTPQPPVQPKNVLIFSQIDMKVPTATWKEIMAARVSDRVMLIWALFLLLVPLGYFIHNIYGVHQTDSVTVRQDNFQLQEITCQPFLERIENLEAAVNDARFKLEQMNTLLVEHIFEQKQTMVNENVSKSNNLPHIEVMTPNKQFKMAGKIESNNSTEIANVGHEMNTGMAPFYVGEKRQILM
ncbi:uncharacterized protein LOC141646360 isoform X2 [Silene latifolia]|uniref:uncharacterized protein LOC141646360 isoform X2 n=1 Tax=Silene latifolia TaxID=37657 RepID=UPI003D772298